MRAFFTAVSLVAVLSAPLARAEPSRAQVERALAGYENPITESLVRSLGEGWEAALIALAKDPNASPVLRVRALAGLGYAQGERARAALREIIAARRPEARGVAVLEAVEAVGSLAKVEGAGAIEVLAPLLDHPAADLRAAAAAALVSTGVPAAETLVRARLEREPDAAVRARLETALQNSALAP